MAKEDRPVGKIETALGTLDVLILSFDDGSEPWITLVNHGEDREESPITLEFDIKDDLECVMVDTSSVTLGRRRENWPLPAAMRSELEQTVTAWAREHSGIVSKAMRAARRTLYRNYVVDILDQQIKALDDDDKLPQASCARFQEADQKRRSLTSQAQRLLTEARKEAARAAAAL